jgi:hypothetical protein
MDTRHYVIESTNGPAMDGAYIIEAKDILKLADDDRAQAPTLSNGSIAGSLTNVATTVILSPTGIGDLEYPASGWVCIGGKEVAAFTRVSDTLTLDRGELGTVAQAHDAGDRVQIVLRYVGNDVADIIYDLLVNYAGVSAYYITLSDWTAETATYLGVIYAATIPQPTSVRQLISELIEQAALVLWWDDRALKIRLGVLREIATDTATFDQDIIIQNTLRVTEQPNKRVSQVWTYYGQRDPTDNGAKEDNYRAALADVALDKEAEYGSSEIRKISARWVETLTAATRLNSLQLSRYRDPPRLFEFELPFGTLITPAAGYQLRWWANQDETGAEIPALIQITQVTIHADRVHVQAEEMLASGVVVLRNVVFLIAESGTLDRPATWNNADNTIECIGAGGGGRRTGGGGGAYSKVTNATLDATELYQAGTGGGPATSGGDSFIGAATLAASLVGAEGGKTGVGPTSNGIGGQAANGVGDVKYSGGDGRVGDNGAGGGGAAAGPHGDGADGGNASSTDEGGAGGGGADGGFVGGEASSQGGDGGDNRYSFGGGNSSNYNGDEGGGGRGGNNSNENGGEGGDGEQLWTQTVTPIISAGPGGGGGGGGIFTGNGGRGGRYGGGGGGSPLGTPGTGGDGIIILSWTEA